MYAQHCCYIFDYIGLQLYLQLLKNHVCFNAGLQMFRAYTKKFLPEDGAVSAETCSRQGDIQYNTCINYVHFGGVLKT